MMSVTLCAYGKINLTLDVGKLRPDGYHEIRSIMQTIELHDTLTVTRTSDHSGITLDITGEEAGGVPRDESNLVYRAAIRLVDSKTGLHISLHKQIPSQAGLGGGSSDAAAALLAINQLLDLGHPLAELEEIGAKLGADVPFFLSGGTALVEGLGERVTKLPDLIPAWSLVIVKPPIGVSTAAAYDALDRMAERGPGTGTVGWLNGEKQISNDFEAVICPQYPQIDALYTLLNSTTESMESFSPLLCGSGASLFCRVTTPEDAIRLAERLQQKGVGKVWVTKTMGARA